MHQTTHQPMRRTGRPIVPSLSGPFRLPLSQPSPGEPVSASAPQQPIHPHQCLAPIRRWLSLLVATLSLLLCAGPATAAQERFTDANDRKGFDIRVVKVRYGDRVNIRVAHDGKVATGQQYKFWFDTKSENAGPEYSFVFAPNSDSFRFRKVNSFSDSGSAVTNCGQSWGGTANIFQPRRDVLAFVGAQCLGAPPRIRVSAQAMVSGPDDWAPGFHKFYGKVARY